MTASRMVNSFLPARSLDALGILVGGWEGSLGGIRRLWIVCAPFIIYYEPKLN